VTITPTRQPAAVARRQLLADRFAELLDEWGAPHAGERAAQLQAVVDDLGFVLPAGIADEPPPPAAHSTPEGRARAKAELAAALAARRPADTPPTDGPHTNPHPQVKL
jgi:hypothetical protein